MGVSSCIYPIIESLESFDRSFLPLYHTDLVTAIQAALLSSQESQKLKLNSTLE